MAAPGLPENAMIVGPGLGERLLHGLAGSMFTQVQLADGKVASTLPALPPNEVVQLPAPTQRSPKPGEMPGAEQSVNLLGTLATVAGLHIFGEKLAIIDELAIKWKLIPKFEEVVTPDLLRLEAAATMYDQLPQVWPQIPEIAKQIDQITTQVLREVEAPKAGDLDAGPSSEEDALAYDHIKTILSSYVIQMNNTGIQNGTIDGMTDAFCPMCRAFPCKCGATSLPLPTLESITSIVATQASQRNKSVTRESVAKEYIKKTQQLGAVQFFAQLQELQEVELMHIPVKAMFAGALLHDWASFSEVIQAWLIPNESGKKGATITLISQPPELGGSAYQITMGSASRRSADARGIPAQMLNASWDQNTMQGFLSDDKNLRKHWVESDHQTIPEAGKLTFTAAGAKAREIPLAVRFDAKKHPRTGGAAILPMAAAKFNKLSQFTMNLMTKLKGEGIAPPKSAEEVVHDAYQEGKKEALAKVVRPAVVAAKARRIMVNLMNNPELLHDSLHALAEPAIKQFQQIEEIKQAHITQLEALAWFETVMHNADSLENLNAVLAETAPDEDGNKYVAKYTRYGIYFTPHQIQDIARSILKYSRYVSPEELQQAKLDGKMPAEKPGTHEDLAQWFIDHEIIVESIHPDLEETLKESEKEWLAELLKSAPSMTELLRQEESRAAKRSKLVFTNLPITDELKPVLPQPIAPDITSHSVARQYGRAIRAHNTATTTQTTQKQRIGLRERINETKKRNSETRQVLSALTRRNKTIKKKK